jgi:tetratricopeptide (TPR) repeat protein
LSLARKLGEQRLEALAIGNLANLHRDQGRPEQALALYDESLAIFREVGARRFEANTSGNLANLVRDRGGMDEARALYEQALHLHRQLGNRQFEGITLVDQSVLERLAGHIDRAETLLNQAEPILLDIDAALHLVLVQCQRGHLCLARDRPAQRFLAQARHIALALQFGPQRPPGHCGC